MERIASIERNTTETQVFVEMNIDGQGECNIDTGIGFFDHMLNSFARHGLFDLEIKVNGDLVVDGHHTVEDLGIVLGQAIKEALGDKAGIKRFGQRLLPMDDALIMCAIDLSGRSYFSEDFDIKAQKVGDFDTELTREFFYAVAMNAGMNLAFKQFGGLNSHHIIEAAFKAFAKALDEATCIDERVCGKIPSTKGTI